MSQMPSSFFPWLLLLANCNKSTIAICHLNATMLSNIVLIDLCLFTGIMEARKVLNQLHNFLAVEGFSEMEVENRGDEIIVVTRHDPTTHRVCYFFIYTAFTPSVVANPQEGGSYEMKGQVNEIVLEARLIVPDDASFVDDGLHINGLPSRCLVSSHSKDIQSKFDFFVCRYDGAADKTHLTMKGSFLPGSVFILMTSGYGQIYQAVANGIRSIEATGVDAKTTRADELHAFSYLLYSCSNEELDRTKGKRGCYELP